MKIYEKGTTLVELLVSITLFLTVVSIIVPTLFTTIKMQRNVNGLVRMHNSLSYSMEYISKEIRTGKKFQPQSPDKSFLRFTNYRNEEVTYQFVNNTLTRQVVGQNSFALISSDVKLNNFQFLVNDRVVGAGLGPANNLPSDQQKQLSVVILANASPAEGLTNITTQFQTTVTPLLRSDIIQD